MLISLPWWMNPIPDWKNIHGKSMRDFIASRKEFRRSRRIVAVLLTAYITLVGSAIYFEIKLSEQPIISYIDQVSNSTTTYSFMGNLIQSIGMSMPAPRSLAKFDIFILLTVFLVSILILRWSPRSPEPVGLNDMAPQDPLPGRRLIVAVITVSATTALAWTGSSVWSSWRWGTSLQGEIFLRGLTNPIIEARPRFRKGSWKRWASSQLPEGWYKKSGRRGDVLHYVRDIVVRSERRAYPSRNKITQDSACSHREPKISIPGPTGRTPRSRALIGTGTILGARRLRADALLRAKKLSFVAKEDLVKTIYSFRIQSGIAARMEAQASPIRRQLRKQPQNGKLNPGFYSEGVERSAVTLWKQGQKQQALFLLKSVLRPQDEAPNSFYDNLRLWDLYTLLATKLDNATALEEARKTASAYIEYADLKTRDNPLFTVVPPERIWGAELSEQVFVLVGSRKNQRRICLAIWKGKFDPRCLPQFSAPDTAGEDHKAVPRDIPIRHPRQSKISNTHQRASKELAAIKSRLSRWDTRTDEGKRWKAKAEARLKWGGLAI